MCRGRLAEPPSCDEKLATEELPLAEPSSCDGMLAQPSCDGSEVELLTVRAASINLTKHLIGVSMFTLPMALLQSSLVLGLCIMMLTCFLQGGSFVMIGYLCKTLNCTSYGGMLAAVFGKRSGDLVEVLVCMFVFFICVAFNIVAADFLEKALDGLFSITDVPRSTLILASTVVTMPLSHARDLSPLRFTSMMGLVVIAFVVIFVIGSFILQIQDSWVNLVEHSVSVDGSPFVTFALCSSTFQAHVNAPRYLVELGGDLDAMVVVARNAFGSTLVICALFAVSGLGLFGSDLFGNALKNFPAEHNALLLACFLGLVFATLFTYPLIFTTGRDTFMSLVPGIKRAAQDRPRTMHILCTSFPVAFIAILACIVPDLSVLMETLGACDGAALCFICPAIVYLKITSVTSFALLDNDAEKGVEGLPAGECGAGRLSHGLAYGRPCALLMLSIGLAMMGTVCYKMLWRLGMVL